MNHSTNLVLFLLLPNLMSFIHNFVWNPIEYKIRQCLNKPGGKKGSGSLKDFLLKVVLNQCYIPYLGWMCLMNPEDNKLKDFHWDLKVILVACGFS